MKENITRERTRNTLQMKEMEEAAAVLEKINAQLKEELDRRDLQNQAKDIVSAAISNSLSKAFNEDIGQCRKKNNCLEEQWSILKSQLVDQELELTQSASLLEESIAKCEIYEEKVSLLTLQLDKAETATGVLNNELILKEKQIEEIKRLADETNEKIMKEVMKNESLEGVIDRYHIRQGELEEKIKEQQLLLTSKQVTVDNSSILEKACRLDYEPMNLKCEPLDRKEQHFTAGQELSKVNEKVLNEQNDKIGNLNDLKSKLKCAMDKCTKLEEANRELERKAEQLPLQMDAREKKMKELDEQVTIFDEKLVSKDITTGKVMMKKQNGVD